MKQLPKFYQNQYLESKMKKLIVFSLLLLGLWFGSAVEAVCQIGRPLATVQDIDNANFSIQNVFTPNGDGVNDVFRPLTQVESYTLQIYTRWGELIHETNNPQNGWNGNLTNGNTAAVGVYYYQLNALTTDGKKVHRTGSLTLLR